MKTNMWLVRPMVLAVSSCFSVPSWANPTAPQVVQGSASFQGLGSNNLTVRNAPGAVINWQGFSIGAGQVTTFAQQSAASAVLNRVVGADISRIQGQLLSNGRVFLINPAGILIGAGAIVDTAGFVGSTLNMLDADFLAGRLKFEGGANSGSIVNQGWIRTGYGGNVVLVAPHIENSGLIQTPGGELLLAAGQKLTLGSLDPNGVQFEIQAPTDSVLNVGRLIADGGAVGVFAGTLKHTGDIRAGALTSDDAGRIVLKAQSDVTLGAGSTTRADGKAGGDILVQAGSGEARIAGAVSATGSAGRGGDIKVLGDRVSIVDNALIDASGAIAGGRLFVGGDYQGGNAALQNASRAFVGPGATLRADATSVGDGGRIIVWADNATQYYGSLSARGGPAGGNGGFAEVSGKQNLLFSGSADLSAARGASGTLLLDPLDLFIADLGGTVTSIIDEAADVASNAVTVSPATLAAIPGNVVLHAGRYMRFGNDVNLTRAGQSLTATVDEWTATDPRGTSPNRMEIAASITTAGGAVELRAPSIQSFNSPTISTVGGGATGAPITLVSNAAINPFTPFEAGATGISLNAGSGAVGLTAGVITPDTTVDIIRVNALTGGSIDATAPSNIQTGAITATGPVKLTSTGSSIFVSGNSSTAGGSFTLTASGVNSFVSTQPIDAVSGNVDVTAKSSIFTTVTTTGSVNLTTSNTGSSSISARVNNGGPVTASATSTGSAGASVSLSSDTDLNAANVAATASGCPFVTSCPSASVFVSATGSVNVGTVTASSLTSTLNNRGESVSIVSGINTGAGIRAMSAASQVKAVDVALTTSAGTGGGIGTAALPLNVNLERSLNFTTNGAFAVNLGGGMPNRVTAQFGVAPTGTSYSGSVQRAAGGLSISASATDTMITVDNPTFVGFNQRVFNSNPFITLGSSNGTLNIPTLVVPEGDTTPASAGPPVVTTLPLSVAIQSAGDLVVGSYTRQSSAASLPKTTSFSSSGNMTLGTVNASKDSVSVSASNAATLADLSTTGPVNVSSFSGDIAAARIASGSSVSMSSSTGNISVGQIDTTSGNGGVTISTGGTVGAQASNPAFEVLSNSAVNVTGRFIGAQAAVLARPLDVKGSSVTLTSTNSGFIGTSANPVIADTQDLTVNAAFGSVFSGTNGSQFNVSTGGTALKNLTVVASPVGVGNGGIARVRTEQGQPNDRTYTFASDGSSFTLNVGTVPSTQFAGGLFSFTSNSGDIDPNNVNTGAGSLALSALAGSIQGFRTFDGKGITLSAATQIGGRSARVTADAIGSFVRPDSVSITAGSTAVDASVLTTSGINAGEVTINAFRGDVRIGAAGTADIGSAGTRAGAVAITTQRNSTGTVGTIRTGNIFADSVSLTDVDGAITTGNLNASTIIGVVTRNSLTAGTLDSLSINVDRDSFLQPTPVIVTNAIGSMIPVMSATLVGNPLTVNGSVTGAAGSSIQLLTNGASTLTVNGPIAGGANSFINLLSRQGYDFTRIDASTTGSVTVNANGAIRQTADGGANGITAKNVSLATGSFITNTGAGGTDPVDLFGTSNLAVSVQGRATFDMHGSTLSRLNVSKDSVAANPFTLFNLDPAQTIALSSGSADATLRVNSPTTPLDFALAYSGGGLTLVNEGIVTNGGPVSVSATGDFNGTVGGIHTGGPLGGGSVVVRGRNITTGAIDTTPTASGAGVAAGGSISVGSNATNGNVVINGNLLTGPAGGFIDVQASTGSVTRSGAVVIRSDGAFVSVGANGDVGSSAAPLSIISPTVFLSARGSGGAFASLTGSNSLDLRGDDGFNVASITAFNTLTVASKGSGTGPLTLTAPGQAFAFARPTTDNFGTALTNTFQVVVADLGAGQPSTNTATFRPSSGDLFIGGGANLNVPTLNLDTFISTADIKLQGNAATALALNNPNLTISSSRDVLITGNATVATGINQTVSASRNIAAQAQQGSITITAPTQTIFSDGNGNVSFLGGSGANEAVSVTGSVRQLIQTPQFATGSIVLQAGTGNNSTVTVAFNGAANTSLGGTDVEQQLQAGGQVRILGGSNAASTGASALVTSSQRQLIRARGTTVLPGEGSIQLTGGAGTGATARIVGTGNLAQQVAEGRCTGSFTCFAEPYQTPSLTLQGGTGTDAIAEITTIGPQQIFATGTLTMKGGTGTGSFAHIESPSTNSQNVGESNFDQTDVILMQGGAGANSDARIRAAGPQTVRATQSTTLAAGSGAASDTLILSTGPSVQSIRPGSLSLSGGTSATTTAKAQIEASGAQSITSVNALTLLGGDGVDSIARIDTPSSQNLSAFGALLLRGGKNTGAVAMIDAGGIQTLATGSVTLAAGGTAAAPVGNAGAIIQGQSQSFCPFSTCGVIALTGGTGVAGAPSDAALRNLSGNHVINAAGVVLTGGTAQSTTEIFNGGTGTQTVSAFGGIALTGNATGTNAAVRIFNPAATEQIVTAPSGGIVLDNTGGDNVTIQSTGFQTFELRPTFSTAIPANAGSRFVDVRTSAGSTGNSSIVSAGKQWIRTSNGTGAAGGSVRVAAFGSGIASIEAGGTQLLEVDYFEHMTTAANPPGTLSVGAASGGGVSRIQAPDQLIFARAIAVQAGAAAGSTSKLTSTNTQSISTVDGPLSVLGGTGANASGAIDPLTQTLVANGLISVRGGSAASASGSIISAGAQTVVSTKNGFTLTGGSASGANASIETPSGQSVIAGTGSIALTAGSVNANALIAGQSQNVTCSGCTFAFTGAAGSAAGNADAIVRNLAGDQTISVGAVAATGGAQFSTVGVINQGSGPQTIVASTGGVALTSHPDAAANASVLLQNVPATAQTITARSGDVVLVSRGAGILAVTSAGSQSMDARALDVRTDAGPTLNGANATVFSTGDQTIHTGGALAAVPNVGVRVVSRGSGTAKIESAATQTLNIGDPERVEGGLVIGSLAPAIPAVPAAANGGVGDSSVIAANQTVRAGSVYVQGPSSDNRVSRLSAAGTQSLTTVVGGITIVGGQGANAFAMIDPTSQTITAAGPVFLQGGTGPNADAIINATGPQSVTSQNGGITLLGGSGAGADALIVTSSASQTVQGTGGAAPTLTAGAGGIAGLQRGNDNNGLQSIAANTLTNELVREQKELGETLEETSRVDPDQVSGRAVQICR